MNQLRDYLRTTGAGPFVPSELNEILLLVYNVLAWAARDGADTLTLTPTEFRWSRDGVVLNQFSTIDPTPSISYRDELHRILARDAIVQRYVHLMDASDGIETFHLGDDTAVLRPA